MTVALIILAVALVVFGIIGCIVPGLPGPILSFLAMVAYQFTNAQDKFTTTALLIWGVIATAVFIGDMVVPAAATKKFGGTKAGVWGGIIGTFCRYVCAYSFWCDLGSVGGRDCGRFIGR